MSLCSTCRPKARGAAVAAVELLADPLTSEEARRVAYEELVEVAELLAAPSHSNYTAEVR